MVHRASSPVKSKGRSSISILIVFTFSVISLLYIAFTYYRRNTETPASDDPTLVLITLEEGQRVNSIAAELKKNGVIKSAVLFKIYLRLNGLGNKLQAGEYEIPRNLSIKGVVEILQHGTFDVRMTFIEGWRAEEMADYIGSQVKGLGFSGVDFLEVAKGYEGKLFPDTYIVPKYTSVRDLVDLMVSTFNQKFDSQMRKDLNNVGLSLDEAVILASIVERETKFAEDRPKVAGILLKRYRNDWPLEADATLQYVLGFQTESDPNTGENISSWWKENLLDSDLNIESPYNTRKNRGLPPGPISNPGIDSLKAVVYPKESDYWYYVSDEDGRLHYAVTLEEHNANVVKYVK